MPRCFSACVRNSTTTRLGQTINPLPPVAVQIIRSISNWVTVFCIPAGEYRLHRRKQPNVPYLHMGICWRGKSSSALTSNPVWWLIAILLFKILYNLSLCYSFFNFFSKQVAGTALSKSKSRFSLWKRFNVSAHLISEASSSPHLSIMWATWRSLCQNHCRSFPEWIRCTIHITFQLLYRGYGCVEVSLNRVWVQSLPSCIAAAFLEGCFKNREDNNMLVSVFNWVVSCIIVNFIWFSNKKIASQIIRRIGEKL